VPFSDKNKQLQYQVRWVQSRRTRFIEDNGPCELCLSAENLKVIRRDGKKLHTNVWGLAEPKRNEALKECRILCAACLKIQRTPPIKHGTQHAYRDRKCRCEICKKAYKL